MLENIKKPIVMGTACLNRYCIVGSYMNSSHDPQKQWLSVILTMWWNVAPYLMVYHISLYAIQYHPFTLLWTADTIVIENTEDWLHVIQVLLYVSWYHIFTVKAICCIKLHNWHACTQSVILCTFSGYSLPQDKMQSTKLGGSLGDDSPW